MKPYLRMSFWDNLGVIEILAKSKPDFSNQLHWDNLHSNFIRQTLVNPNFLTLIGDGPELSPFRARRKVLTEIQIRDEILR